MGILYTSKIASEVTTIWRYTNVYIIIIIIIYFRFALKGAWSSHVNHLNFGVLIGTEECECKHDVLLPKGICS